MTPRNFPPTTIHAEVISSFIFNTRSSKTERKEGRKETDDEEEESFEWFYYY